MINLHWLELFMARTLFHGPKGVRAIEVRLYLDQTLLHQILYYTQEQNKHKKMITRRQRCLYYKRYDRNKESF